MIEFANIWHNTLHRHTHRLTSAFLICALMSKWQPFNAYSCHCKRDALCHITCISKNDAFSSWYYCTSLILRNSMPPLVSGPAKFRRQFLENQAAILVDFSRRLIHRGAFAHSASRSCNPFTQIMSETEGVHGSSREQSSAACPGARFSIKNSDRLWRTISTYLQKVIHEGTNSETRTKSQSAISGPSQITSDRTRRPMLVKLRRLY